MSARRTARSEAGFGLIEVLAAMLVLAIGTIGFAALQIRAMQTSNDSGYRTQAMAIAQDLAERVRANPTAMTTYLTATNWPLSVSTYSAAPNSCMTAACNSTNMALFDIASVRYGAQTLLPRGIVNMQACQASARTCVYVAWEGVLPTAGTAGQCVGANGIYVAPPANMTTLPCVMLEF